MIFVEIEYVMNKSRNNLNGFAKGDDGDNTIYTKEMHTIIIIKK